MNSQTFSVILNRQITRCLNILGQKAEEYGPVDRLHNFRKAAAFKNTTMRQVLSGMMLKHTVSIDDMCDSTNHFTEAQWNEKITDGINYLILLRAIVEEEGFAKEVEK